MTGGGGIRRRRWPPPQQPRSFCKRLYVTTARRDGDDAGKASASAVRRGMTKMPELHPAVV